MVYFIPIKCCLFSDFIVIIKRYEVFREREKNSATGIIYLAIQTTENYSIIIKL